MLITLDLNQTESKQWHEIINYLEYYGKIKEYDEATPSVLKDLGRLIYQVYRRKI